MRTTVTLALLGLVLAGCSSSSGQNSITVGAARTYHLAGFAPPTFAPDQPERVSFTVDQPSGVPLTRYRKGPGPHTGVHLIIVRSDLGTIVHTHPPVGANGMISGEVTLPTPGRYRAVVDIYPQATGPFGNFQLFRWITVKGKPVTEPLPPFRRSVTVDGYRFTLRSVPRLRAIQASSLTFSVTDPSGRPATFTPWFGALAHAIFFRAGSLAYFHTHVCAPGATGCTSVLGPTRVTGTSTRPGVLRVGLLVPVAGTWRLFLQCRPHGHVLTAPFTLNVR
jgi:hypothetical protein